MFKRRKAHTDKPLVASREVPAAGSVAGPSAPAEALAESRTTSYPQDGDGPPPVAGQPKTTVYRQSMKWNRGGYDTIN